MNNHKKDKEFDSDLIDNLIQSDEGQTLEFKKSGILSDTIKLASLIAALANSNGGWILIGICDDGSIEGMKEKKEHERHIMNIGRDLCDPPIIPDFSVVQKPEGDIYIIKITRYRKLPHAVKTKEGNVFFIRAGSTVRKAETYEIALLFEGTSEKEIPKTPMLELQLLDLDDNTKDVIEAKPIIIKKKYVKRPSYPQFTYETELAKLMVQTQGINILTQMYGQKEPPKDLVPIGIEIGNIGEIPAEGIKIFLKFPDECELVSEYDAIGSSGILSIFDKNPTSGGLFIDDKKKSEASAWIDVLGNDLIMRHFKKVYVRFPEGRHEYKVRASITQFGYPSTQFEFKIIIDAKIEEEIVYIDENKPKITVVEDETKE